MNLEFKPRKGDHSINKPPADLHFETKVQVVCQTRLWQHTDFCFRSVLTNLDSLFVVDIVSYSSSQVVASISRRVSEPAEYVRALLACLDHNRQAPTPRAVKMTNPTCIAASEFPPSVPDPHATGGGMTQAPVEPSAPKGAIASSMPQHHSATMFHFDFVQAALKNMEAPKTVKAHAASRQPFRIIHQNTQLP